MGAGTEEIQEAAECPPLTLEFTAALKVQYSEMRSVCARVDLQGLLLLRLVFHQCFIVSTAAGRKSYGFS